MNCNNDFHRGILIEGYICCPFCSEQLKYCLMEHDLCCDMEDITDDNGIRVCRSFS